MAEILVVGPRNFTLGFRLAGVRRIYDTAEREASEVFEELLSKGEHDLLITDYPTFRDCRKSLQERLEMSLAPIVIVISESGEYDAELRERIRTAIGVDLFEDESKEA